MPLSEIGRIGHFQLGELPNSVQPILSHTRRFRLLDDLYIFTNGIHGCHVEVDVETGFIKLLKMWVVEDCGRVINPQLADEQVRGGCVQGLGGALYEHCIYDEAGQLTSGTMADYLVPMAAEMPDIDVMHIADADLGVGTRRQGRRRIRHRRRPRRGDERHQRRAAPLQRPRHDAAHHAGGDPHGAGADLSPSVFDGIESRRLNLVLSLSRRPAQTNAVVRASVLHRSPWDGAGPGHRHAASAISWKNQSWKPRDSIHSMRSPRQKMRFLSRSCALMAPM